MLPVARIGDSYSDGDTQMQGSGNVFVNNIPVARLGDLTTGHKCSSGGWWPSVPIIQGSGSVFVNNIPVARLGDAHATHCCGDSCHNGVFVTGSGNVFSG